MSWTAARARIGAHAKNHPGEPTPDHLVVDLRAERAADYIAKIVSEAPPLSDDQRARLALLLRPSKAGAS